MTCDETRDRFSDLGDDRLTPSERAAVDAHLATCAVCPTELDRFRATVALLRSIDAPRAPAGFVDRVVGAARPQPRWRRVAARALFPLPVKLPLEAAAVVLVGVGVAYLFQRTPELQDAARFEAPVVVERPASAPPAATPPAPSTAAPATIEPPQAPAVASRPESTAPAKERAADAPAPAERPQREAATETLRAERARPGADAPDRPARDDAARAPAAPVPQAADARRSEAAPAPPVAESKRDAATAPAPETRAKAERAPATALQRAPGTSAPATEPAPGAPPAAGARAPGVMAKAAPLADAAGTLTVAARAAAEQSVRELAARHGGQIVASHREPAALEVTVPGADYRRFAAGLATIGRWQADREPADVRAEVRVMIRLVD